MLLNYDWKETRTVDWAEKNLSKFRYKGHGWYETETDTLLVEPSLFDGRVTIYCWNTPNGRKVVADLFTKLMCAPVHTPGSRSRI